jgi:hypothetical protein
MDGKIVKSTATCAWLVDAARSNSHCGNQTNFSAFSGATERFVFCDEHLTVGIVSLESAG